MASAEAPAPAPAAPAAAAVAPRRLVRFAVDSDDLSQLFPADFVRTYSDLIRNTGDLAALRARFPDSVVELIDRGLGDPTGAATIANIEPGALTAAEGADRIRAWHAEGRPDLIAYCDQALIANVVAACRDLSYWHWIAAWGQLVIAGHPSAQVQFANAGMLGLHADLTIIWNPAYRARAAAAPDGSLLEAAGADEETLARLRGIAQGLSQHQGLLAVLERDLTLIPELAAAHAGLLAELVHLLP